MRDRRDRPIKRISAVRCADPSLIERRSGAHRHIPILNYLLSVLERQRQIEIENEGSRTTQQWHERRFESLSRISCCLRRSAAVATTAAEVRPEDEVKTTRSEKKREREREE